MRDIINSSLNNWRLPIPPQLKTDFLQHQYRLNANFMVLITIIGHLAFYSYAIADYLLVPEVFERSIIYRTLFLLLLLPPHIYLIKKVRNIVLLEMVFAFNLMLATALWLGVLLPQAHGEVVHFYVYAAIIFVVVLNLVIRSTFWLALAVSLLHTAATLYFVALLNHTEWERMFVYAIVYLPVLYFSLFISWHNTHTARRLYLHSVIEELDRVELEQANRKLDQLAHTDSLTGLPNRAMFDDRLHQAITLAKRDGGKLALLFIDLDRFKPVNDSHGHAVGDLLLQRVSQRMVANMRESDTVARIGGDEFEVLLPSVESDEDARVVAGKVLDALSSPFELNGITLHISSSIGIALYPEHGSNSLELFKQADEALYRAKELGRNRVEMAA